MVVKQYSMNFTWNFSIFENLQMSIILSSSIPIGLVLFPLYCPGHFYFSMCASVCALSLCYVCCCLSVPCSFCKLLVCWLPTTHLSCQMVCISCELSVLPERIHVSLMGMMVDDLVQADWDPYRFVLCWLLLMFDILWTYTMRYQSLTWDHFVLSFQSRACSKSSRSNSAFRQVMQQC